MRRACVAVVVVGVLTVAVRDRSSPAAGSSPQRRGQAGPNHDAGCYKSGVEHYVTVFSSTAPAASSGSIVPLPGVRPTWSVAATGRCSAWCER